jgi:hypothetical protein
MRKISRIRAGTGAVGPARAASGGGPSPRTGQADRVTGRAGDRLDGGARDGRVRHEAAASGRSAVALRTDMAGTAGASHSPTRGCGTAGVRG